MKYAKIFAFFYIIFLTVQLHAQNIYYAAAKAGLNLRERADISSPVIEKIPYGSKINLIRTGDAYEIKPENMSANWIYVSFGEKKGYVANVYTLPVMPPKAGTTLQHYADALSKPKASWNNGIKFTTDSTLDASAVRIEKTIYTNGIVVRKNSGYEWVSETIWIPNISMQQAFVFSRLLCQNASLLKMSDLFPTKSITSTDDSVRSIFIVSHYENMDDPDMIRFNICEAGCSWIEIKNDSGEISITFGSGV